MSIPYRARVAALLIGACAVLIAGGFFIGRLATAQDGHQDQTATNPGQPSSSASTPPVLDGDSPAPDPTSTPRINDTSIPEEPAEETPAPRGEEGTPRGAADLPEIDTADPAQIAMRFMTLLHTWDARIDTRPADSAIRAADLATKPFAKELISRPTGAAGEEWNQLHANDAYTSADAQLDNLGEQPPDTNDLTIKIVTVTYTPHNDNDWTGQPATQTAAIGLTHTKTGWKVTKYHLV